MLPEQQHRPPRLTCAHDFQTAREPRDPAPVLPYALEGLAALVQDALEQVARARHADAEEVRGLEVAQDLQAHQDEPTTARSK